MKTEKELILYYNDVFSLCFMIVQSVCLLLSYCTVMLGVLLFRLMGRKQQKRSTAEKY